MQTALIKPINDIMGTSTAGMTNGSVASVKKALFKQYVIAVAISDDMYLKQLAAAMGVVKSIEAAAETMLFVIVPVFASALKIIAKYDVQRKAASRPRSGISVDDVAGFRTEMFDDLAALSLKLPFEVPEILRIVPFGFGPEPQPADIDRMEARTGIMDMWPVEVANYVRATGNDTLDALARESRLLAAADRKQVAAMNAANASRGA